ncbi:MAG: hypothetical protein BGO28_02265 [Alphaproteobacteria bacterium 43-37]|nr:MAG: hypothetical protein BGO28_02265 [Alphaproteobacteria bacterium 43-37]
MLQPKDWVPASSAGMTKRGVREGKVVHDNEGRCGKAKECAWFPCHLCASSAVTFALFPAIFAPLLLSPSRKRGAIIPGMTPNFLIAWLEKPWQSH